MTPMWKSGFALALVVVLVVLGTHFSPPRVEEGTIRVGHFPTITHPHALVGQATGWFARALEPEAKIAWKIFNAGPSVIEALFAGEIDLAYLGPNPAINAYVKSHGQALRVIAGACSGGTALVVRRNGGIATPDDLHNKKIATPQLGNTQDIALRTWLAEKGYSPREKGGDVSVMPVRNADQLTLFLKKEIDGAWTVEPWVSRLIREGGGALFLDERQLWPGGKYATTLLVGRTAFLREHRDLVKKWVEAHVELTRWISAHAQEAKKILNREITRETGQPLSPDVLNDAFSRLDITYDPLPFSLTACARRAFEQGFLGSDPPDVSGMYDLSVLTQVLVEKGLPRISSSVDLKDPTSRGGMMVD